ncbi:hypothetical protein TNCV_2280301 [Trichonephila clavipes]|nr:hypothetical protein TNCV_2280301 [Trichonephila clavipes]
MKVGRFDLGTFRSENKYLSHHAKTIVLAWRLLLVYIDITPPHIPVPVIRRIGERTIPYSWREFEQLRHFEYDSFVGCVVVCEGLIVSSV